MELSDMIHLTTPLIVLFITGAGLGVGYVKANSPLRRSLLIAWAICAVVMAVLTFGDLTKISSDVSLAHVSEFWMSIVGAMQTLWAMIGMIVLMVVYLLCSSHNPDISWSDPKMRQKARAASTVAILSSVTSLAIALAWLGLGVTRIMTQFGLHF
ncbi:hypothetical protein IJ847_02880 [Candidatus Saccharibacteria bacterium]|nr:hypothetical protein [Candidatus Saccharibacteria bacterium]